MKNVKEEVLSTKLRIDELELGVFTPRLNVDQRYVNELAEDIDRNGLQKPIIVRPHPDKENVFQVIDGEYRVRALKKLGHSLVRAEVRILSDSDALFLAMSVNEIHGKRLEPVEEAMHIKRMMEELELTEGEVAARLGKSQPWVSQRLNMIKSTIPEVQKAVITRVIKPAHVREIARLSKNHQLKVLEKIKEKPLSSRKVAKLVEALKEKPEKADLILSQPVSALAEIYKPIEEFKKAAVTPPEKPVIEFFTCACGRRYVIDWIAQTIKEVPPESEES